MLQDMQLDMDMLQDILLDMDTMDTLVLHQGTEQDMVILHLHLLPILAILVMHPIMLLAMATPALSI